MNKETCMKNEDKSNNTAEKNTHFLSRERLQEKNSRIIVCKNSPQTKQSKC